MAYNEFMIALLAKLEKLKSKAQINKDIKELEKIINTLRLTAVLARGDSKRELNQNIKEKKTNKIIVATGSYIGEGFDDSSLDVLFLTMPISGITKVTQYTGRLHRKNKDKSEIIVYDYVDNNFRQTRNMFEKRLKTYEKLGYNINK